MPTGKYSSSSNQHQQAYQDSKSTSEKDGQIHGSQGSNDPKSQNSSSSSRDGSCGQHSMAKVIKVMKDHHLLLQIQAEPLSKMLALANKVTKIANQ